MADEPFPTPRYRLADFDAIEPVVCPCGLARRAFHDVEEFPATIHRTTITAEARPHYHERLTETYYILECEPGAALRLDDEHIALRPGMCILIPPRAVHQAIGRMTILNFVLPKFDPTDEVLV